MPHKVGSKWKWGNVERSSKKELLQTVYGIWKKNGGKGSFSKFWRTGSVSECEIPDAELDSFRPGIGPFLENAWESFED